MLKEGCRGESSFICQRFENSPSKETKVAKTPRFCNGVFSEAGGGGYHTSHAPFSDGPVAILLCNGGHIFSER